MIITIDAEQVVAANLYICTENSTPHTCYDIGKVESALHSAFYPGSYPFHHGGLAKIAGAMAFYLTKAHAFFDGNKRTALLSSVTFLELNGIGLSYPTPKIGWSDHAIAINAVAEGSMGIDAIKSWYDVHKAPLG